jgi:hypothetical protein
MKLLRTFTLFTLALAISSSLFLHASDVAGRIEGTVVDPSGAAIAGAALTAQDTRTGVEAHVKSGEGGAFSFRSLLPGAYTVKCELAGFKTAQASDVRVLADETTTLNIKLEVGRVESEVNVVARPAQVDTHEAAIQSSVGQDFLNSLPVEGRDPLEALELTQPGTTPGVNGIRFNGQRDNTGNNYKIDGTESVDFYNGGSPAFPSVENLSEFAVVTNASSAKYGTGGGGQVTAVLKSGTNNLHGMLWTYLTNQAWNANSWVNNRNGIARPSGSQRWFGGNIGGPVFIPKLYNGKNKTFFFFSYEQTHLADHPLQQQRILTNAERQGDFSADCTSPGNDTCPVINGVRTPQLDPSTFSPMAKALLGNTSLLPTASDPTGNFAWLGSVDLSRKPIVVKIDEQIGSKHRIFGSLFAQNDRKIDDPLYGIEFGSATLPNEGDSRIENKLKAWTFNYTYIISDRRVNTAIFSARPLEIDWVRNKVNPSLSWSAVGVNTIQQETGSSLNQVAIFVNGGGPQGFALWGNYDNPLKQKDYYFSDDFNWVKGRHTLEAGVDFRNHTNINFQNFLAAGFYNFQAGQAGSVGNSYADFLLGQGASFSQLSLLNNRLLYPSREAYVQDEFHATRRLVLNLGLRWAPHFGASEAHDRLGAFRPGEQSVLFPTAPVGLVVPGDPGVPRATYPNRYLNFGPRLGFAYDVLGNGKMALRAGYGIYYDFENLLGFDQFAANTPYGLNYQPQPPSSVVDPYQGQQLFPYVVPVPGTPQAKNFVFAPQLTLRTFDPHFNAGRIHQWNVSYQWEPVHDYLLGVAYVATRGTHLSTSVDLNTPVFIPNASTEDPANVESRRPYPQFQNIFANLAAENSRYNSLQLTLNKRLSTHFSLMGAYTYSLATDGGDTVGSNFNSGNYRDPYHRNLDYGPSTFDVRHVLTLNYNWELPSPFRAHELLGKLAGGWVLSETLRATSGDPLTITSPTSLNQGAITDAFSASGAWANYVGSSPYTAHNSRAAEAAAWLDINAFCDAFHIGANCATLDPQAGAKLLIGNSKRGMARGPGSFMNDMSLSKRFPISERWGSLELRATAFNIFNHTLLGDPDTNIADGVGVFGRIFSAAPPRRFQLAAHYSF